MTLVLETRKFSPLWGDTSLAVALEFNFAQPLSAEQDSICRAYESRGRELVHRRSEESVVRLYEPAHARIEKDGSAFITFPAPHREHACFMRIMFKRKGEHMTCARFGETRCFGFSAERVRANYLPLAYPGKTGAFVPVFFKVKTVSDAALFLEVAAADDITHGRVVVRVRERVRDEVPLHLHLVRF